MSCNYSSFISVGMDRDNVNNTDILSSTISTLSAAAAGSLISTRASSGESNDTAGTMLNSDPTEATDMDNVSSTSPQPVIDQGTVFLQTAAAQGIAGAFSFAAMFITCHQVNYCIHV